LANSAEGSPRKRIWPNIIKGAVNTPATYISALLMRTRLSRSQKDGEKKVVSVARFLRHRAVLGRVPPQSQALLPTDAHLERSLVLASSSGHLPGW
jgi:hypothetical protein